MSDELAAPGGAAAPGPILERLHQLSGAVTAGGEFISDAAAARAKLSLRRAEERLAVGKEFVVVAIIGGTGSGKSTLFNALTELSFAQVGQTRPTTAEVAACTWGSSGQAVLDLLGVPRHRRTRYDTPLNAGSHTLDGLVLLDMPDYDSVIGAHRQQVENLSELIDGAIWVWDPEKYQESAAFDYLVAPLRERGVLTIVMNQTDTIAPEKMADFEAKVRSELAARGYEQVPLIFAAAKRREGLDPIRDFLAAAVKQPDLASGTVLALLDKVALL